MASVKIAQPVQSERERSSIRSRWQAIKQQLEAKKAANRAEIQAYPRPITACDAQFNYLLEERNNIAQELQRVEAASQEEILDSTALSRIEAFVNSSHYINSAMLPVVDTHRVATVHERR